ncbi:MAG: G8 domain-containing protein [Pseudomonadota bacterium]
MRFLQTQETLKLAPRYMTILCVLAGLTACSGAGDSNEAVSAPPPATTPPATTEPPAATEPPAVTNDQPVVTGTSDPTDNGNGSDHSGSSTPHSHHCAMTPEFVALNLMTHTATQSGAWSDAATWGGNVPDDGAVAQIPEGIEVTVARALSSRLATVRIDGALKFALEQNTQMNVDTLFSSCSGVLEIGTQGSPVRADVTARIVFVDNGLVSDAKLLRRGAILMGKTSIHGAPKTHRAVISPQARQGDTVLNLDILPMGWQLDDQLIVTGTTPNNPESDEIRRISQIDGQRISLSTALSLDHRAPKADLNVYVANATRNIEFVSENPAVNHRGHIMFMSLDVSVQNARFTELGRTDKTRPLDDVEFLFQDGSDGDDAPEIADLMPLGGSNVRGRYAIHFHRAGTDPQSSAALVKGSVVFNGPGWGFVNHSSHVDFIDNVSYGLQGAGFYTEAGNEIGRMQGNLAIRSVNSSFTLDDQGAIDPDLRATRMDYGNDGDGFWLTGNRVSLVNNVSAGASAHGIIYWTDGIMEPDVNPAIRTSIPVAHLPNGNLIPDRESVPVWWAPLAESGGNESYGATIGFRSRYVHAKNYLGREEQSDFHRSPPQAYIDTLNPTIRDLTVWGSRDGVLLNYNERMNLLGARIQGFGRDQSEFSFNPGTAKSGVGLDISNDSTHGPGRVENVMIEGFGVGLATPVNGEWDFRAAALSGNGIDILILEPENNQTRIRLQDVQYTSFQNYEQGDTSDLPNHVTVIE